MRRRRLRLIQIRRPDDPMLVHEQACFALACGIDLSELLITNVFDDSLSGSLLGDCDVLMIGGSGDYYVSSGHSYHWFGPLSTLARLIVAEAFPMFASCWGFQLLVASCGGAVIQDPAHMEIGTFELTLEPAAQHDPLFKGLPRRFEAQLGHKDRAARLPENAIPLARSPLCPYQALRFAHTPIYATQFHPELTGDQNRERFHHYREGYQELDAPPGDHSFFPSPEANTLLGRYLELLDGGPDAWT